MAVRNWTDEQKDAISGRDGTLLLSAAAGSGKTAVLVERVLQRFIDPVEPCNPENLLIVTFTNAAAAEMKHKILKAVSEYAENQEQKAEFFKLRVQINNADICTMDKFCIKLVRENYSLLEDITPDFRICEGGELDIMRAAAMEQTISELHNDYTEILEPLTDMFFREKNDNNLTDCIGKLYDESRSYPFPEEWLDAIGHMYDGSADIENTSWGKLLLENACDVLIYCIRIYDEIIDAFLCECQTDSTLYDKFNSMLESERDYLKFCLELALNKDWDDLYLRLQKYSVDDFRAPKGYAQAPLKIFAADKRTIVKNHVGHIKSSICALNSEHKEDMRILFPVANALSFAAKLFTKNFAELKKEANTLDFSDVLHEAIKLLYTFDGEKRVKSELAQKLSEQYTEILIDEYQDTNKAQDMLFRGLSKDESNLFMVGDVKQSIYKFRKASPEIFIEHSKKLKIYDKEINAYPAKVILGKNFRSNRKVIDGVNYIFKRIMSEKAGGLDYNESEMLYCGRKDSGELGSVQFRLLDLTKKSEEQSKSEAEADYIARLIKKSVTEKELIFDEKCNSRPTNYGDYCILLRAASTKLTTYVNALKNHGIPVLSDADLLFFESKEIRMLVSFLKIISNPLNDIEFLSVMLSPFYGFTADEVAEMRLNYSANTSLYENMKKAAAENNAKAEKMLKDIEAYRFLAATGKASSFLRTLLDETKYRAAVLAMENPDARNANISYMIELAENYDSFTSKGASGFIPYLLKLRDADMQKQNPSSRIKAPGAAVGMGGSVKIMTIHASKGLEFPIVILADCMKGFNRRDLYKDLIINPTLGIGIKILDLKTYKKYPSLAHNAVSLKMKDEGISEEMRLLYVALTRAREKLIMLATSDKLEKDVADVMSSLMLDKGVYLPESIKTLDSYGEWLIAAFLRLKNAENLRELLADKPIMEEFILDDDSQVDIIIDKYDNMENNQAVQAESGQEDYTIDDEKISEIQEYSQTLHERADYIYPYLDLSRVVAKYAASSLSHKGINIEYAASSKPNFMKTDSLDGADAGTATHLFLQYCDYMAASLDYYAEIERMIDENLLTKQQAEAMNAKKILAFLNSNLAKRISTAEKVYKEQHFTISLDVKEIDSSLPYENGFEQVLVQGVSDLIFIENGEAVIVDYKTDRVSSLDILKQKYAMQLSIYKKAAERVMGVSVKQTLIYSLYLEDFIEL